MGGSTLKYGRVCMACHKLGCWSTNYSNDVWPCGAFTNVNSTPGYGKMFGNQSPLSWWWIILVSNKRENKVCNTSLTHSPIIMKLPSTGLVNFFVGCHSSGIAYINTSICPCLSMLPKHCTNSNMSQHLIHSIFLINMHQSNMASRNKQPQLTPLPPVIN